MLLSFEGHQTNQKVLILVNLTKINIVEWLSFESRFFIAITIFLSETFFKSLRQLALSVNTMQNLEKSFLKNNYFSYYAKIFNETFAKSL